MPAVVADVFQLYALAPLALRLAELPEQMVALFTATFGVAFTVMTWLDVPDPDALAATRLSV